MTTSAFSQAILIVFTPVLARIYGPVAFGIFATFSAVHAIVIILTSGKFDLAIILPLKDEEASDIVALLLLLAAVIGIGTPIVVAAYGAVAGRAIDPIYYLLSVSCAAALVYASLLQWLARKNDYHTYSIAQIINAATNVTVSIGIGIASHARVNGLVIGFIAGILVSSVYVYRVVHARPTGAFHFRFAIGAALSASRRYRRFPFFVLPMWLLATLATSLPPILLQGFFSLAVVGNYAVAARFLVAPMSIISGAVGEPFRIEYVARMKSGGSPHRLVQRTLLSMALVAVPIFGFAAFAGPTVIAFLLGQRFNDAGHYVRLMSLGALGQFLAIPVATYVFVATNRVKLGLAMQALLTLAPALALIIVASAGAIGPALLAQSTALLFASAMYVIAAHAASKQSERQLNRTIAT